MKTIDLSQYIKSGEGANGSSYDKIGDNSIMLKLYNEDYPEQPIYEELDIAKKVYQMGVPSPEPGELVTDGRRKGILFKRIVGKRSYARAMADEPERVEEYSREFARYCKKLHSTVCPKGLFPDVKDQYATLLDGVNLFNDSQKQIILDFLASVPDCDTALHGDMHIGNVITTLPKGAPMSDPHEVYFIDLGYFAHGCPLFDIGMSQNICIFSDEEFRKESFHVGYETTKLVWKYFVDEYFFGPEKNGEKWFGSDVTPDIVNEKMIKFTATKLLLVAFNLGFLPGNYIPVVNEAFGFDLK